MKGPRDLARLLKESRQDRALRRHPSPFAMGLFDSIRLVPEQAWNSVVPPGSTFLRTPYLAALEECRPRGMAFRYALLHLDRRPVAAAVFQVIAFTGSGLGSRREESEPPKNLLDRVRGGLKNLARGVRDQIALRLLVSGNVFISGEHGFAHAPDIPATEAFQGLADAIYRVRRADKLHGEVSTILVKDFSPPTVAGARELKRFGYREFHADPNMEIVVRPGWKTFDAYLASVTSKYRRRLRDTRNKGRLLVRRPLDAAAIEKHGDRIEELYLAVAGKSDFRMALVNGDYFRRVKEALGDDFELEGYFLDDRLAGFGSRVWRGREMETYYLGMDYALNAEHAIYQNILYDDLERGIERGASRILWGRTAHEMKSGLGAVPLDLACFVRQRDPVTNPVVQALCGLVKPSKWTPRSPFKEEE